MLSWRQASEQARREFGTDVLFTTADGHPRQHARVIEIFNGAGDGGDGDEAEAQSGGGDIGWRTNTNRVTLEDTGFATHCADGYWQRFGGFINSLAFSRPGSRSNNKFRWMTAQNNYVTNTCDQVVRNLLNIYTRGSDLITQALLRVGRLGDASRVFDQPPGLVPASQSHLRQAVRVVCSRLFYFLRNDAIFRMRAANFCARHAASPGFPTDRATNFRLLNAHAHITYRDLIRLRNHVAGATGGVDPGAEAAFFAMRGWGFCMYVAILYAATLASPQIFAPIEVYNYASRAVGADPGQADTHGVLPPFTSTATDPTTPLHNFASHNESVLRRFVLLPSTKALAIPSAVGMYPWENEVLLMPGNRVHMHAQPATRVLAGSVDTLGRPRDAAYVYPHQMPQFRAAWNLTPAQLTLSPEPLHTPPGSAGVTIQMDVPNVAMAWTGNRQPNGVHHGRTPAQAQAWCDGGHATWDRRGFTLYVSGSGDWSPLTGPLPAWERPGFNPPPP